MKFIIKFLILGYEVKLAPTADSPHTFRVYMSRDGAFAEMSVSPHLMADDLAFEQGVLCPLAKNIIQVLGE